MSGHASQANANSRSPFRSRSAAAGLRVAWPMLLRVCLLCTAIAVWPEPSRAVPSYARQMNMPCNGCHVQFPVLNEFGRQFKMGGYTMIAQPTISEEDAKQRKLLDLPLASLLSVMFQTDLTYLDKRQPGTANTDVQLPDQASVFFAGRIAPQIGAFVQMTYSGAEDKFGIDNADLRYANRAELFSKPVLWGLSVNNNPTSTDPWNSTPAWGYPFVSSPSAPTPAASPLIEGGIAQQVAGVTAYSNFNELLYTEAGVYRAAPLGVDRPLTRDGTVSGVAPYWRAALHHVWGSTGVMLGHFGMIVRQDPDSGGPENRFTDLGVDLQIQQPIGSDVVQLLARWVNERATWGVGNAEHGHTQLDELRLAATYYLGQRYGFTLGPFATFGSKDTVLFAPDSVSGSANGRPNSDGIVAELSYNPWMNTRFTAQYTSYFEFNGRSQNYDGAGRDAWNNNTFFLQAWFAW
jgi:hypothetical protein